MTFGIISQGQVSGGSFFGVLAFALLFVEDEGISRPGCKNFRVHIAALCDPSVAMHKYLKSC